MTAAAPLIDEPIGHALVLATCGLRVLPIKPGAKYPPMNSWQHAASTDPKVITNWYRGLYQGHGVGIAMGPQPDGRWIFALDVDEHDPSASGSDTLHDLETIHGKLPDTVRSITGAGGQHIILAAPEGVEVRNGVAGLGIDVRGDGGQIVVAPTVHPTTGTAYAWEHDRAPWEIDIAVAPTWVLDLVVSEASIDPPVHHAPFDGTADLSPADHLRVAWNWHTELTARGWQLHHADRRTGDTHWTSPHKDLREGASAVLHEPDGPLNVFTTHPSAQEMWKLGKAGRDNTCVAVSPFVFYATYEYSGDASAAAKAIRDHIGHPFVTTIGDIDPATPDESDWAPISLAGIASAMRSGDYQPITPSLLEVEGASALLYPGRTNSLFGESGGGKTWVALAATAEVVRLGQRALYIDYEDTPAGIAERLVLLGISDDEIALVDYRNPTTGLGFGIEYIARHIDETRYALVVLDSTGEAMASGAVNPNADDEVAMWFRKVKEMTRLPGGPAIVVLDHVPKDRDAPASYAIGSQRKRAAVNGAAYRVDTLKEPAKGRDGKLKLTVAKDRPGNRAKGTTAAEVDITSGDAGTLTLRFHISDAQAAHDAGEKWRPTIYMERVSQWLEFNPGASLRAITEGCQGKKEVIYSAVEVLTEEGWVSIADGPRNARLHTVVKAYKESIDPKLTVDNSTLAPSPDCPPTVPQGAVSHPGTVPHPLTKGDGDGGTVDDLSTDHHPLDYDGEGVF